MVANDHEEERSADLTVTIFTREAHHLELPWRELAALSS